MHDLFAKSKLFPANPLSIKKKNLKEAYALKLDHTYIEQESKIYVIDFAPKNQTTEFFAGTIWIDQTNNRLIKISLTVQNSSIHPFVPIGYNTIEEVNMQVTKSFENIDGKQYINTIEKIVF